MTAATETTTSPARASVDGETRRGLGTASFVAVTALVALAVFTAIALIGQDYVYFATYIVLQFVVLATAWNVLGGYCGYVNFGSAAFFATGAYTTVFITTVATDLSDTLAGKAIAAIPVGILLPLLIVLAGIIAGAIGLGMGYLTLRLKGVFFSIATLAMSVVLETLVTNWDFVGGSRGAYVLRPSEFPVVPGGFVGYLFALMLILAVFAIAIARTIERSRLGFGFAAIRDDELAAEAAGVPTLRLKLIATTVSGGLMGMAGAMFPYYIGYLQPDATFGLDYAVNAIAMPMVGGAQSWVGPLIGALLLGTFQQVATVTISSVLNVLIVGLLLIVFVIAAPNGITGLVRDLRRKRAQRRAKVGALS